MNPMCADSDSTRIEYFLIAVVRGLMSQDQPVTDIDHRLNLQRIRRQLATQAIHEDMQAL